MKLLHRYEKVHALEEELNDIVIRYLKENDRYPSDLYYVSCIEAHYLPGYFDESDEPDSQKDHEP